MPKEIITPQGDLLYRTKLIPSYARATGFARCLQNNSCFQSVDVVTSEKAKEPAWYVTFKPANIERQRDLFERQFNARQRRGEAEGMDYIFWHDDTTRFWWCLSLSLEVYEVTPFSCSCPDWQFRCRKAGLLCKHQHALKVQGDAGKLKPFGSKLPALSDLPLAA